MRPLTRPLAGLGLLLLSACAAPLQGPDLDMIAVATPPPVPVVAPTLPPAPVSPAGTFRAWVPRQVAPNGDAVDGHWLTISLTPPAVEVVEPVKPMPRAPRQTFAPKKPPAATSGQTPALASPGQPGKPAPSPTALPFYQSGPAQPLPEGIP